MKNLIKKARWLSIDIAMGSLILLFFVCDIHQIPINPFVSVALFIAVWLIYTWDHLLDVKTLSRPSTLRHKFHKNHFAEITRVSFLVLLFGLINFLFIPIKVAMYGLILTLFSAFYLVFQKKLSLVGMKEFTVALGYTCGIFLYPLVRLGFTENILAELLITLILSYVNILIVAKYDLEADRKDHVTSLPLIRNSVWVERLIYFLLILGVLFSLAGMLFFNVNSYYYFTLISFSVLFSVNFFVSFFSKNDRFRVLADGIFFLPILFIIW